MPKFIPPVLIVLSLIITTAITFFVQPAALSAGPSAQPASPISPLDPTTDDEDSDDDHHDDDGHSSHEVWQPQTNSNQMLIRTRQVGLGWWDAEGNLHIELQHDGVVKIPLDKAVMISIPGDAAGIPIPAGWRKTMRPENGEYVIVPAP
ncbi:MAG: hypothetical protein R3C14_35260 [Caldilineaceae bacterium]